MITLIKFLPSKNALNVILCYIHLDRVFLSLLLNCSKCKIMFCMEVFMLHFINILSIIVYFRLQWKKSNIFIRYSILLLFCNGFKNQQYFRKWRVMCYIFDSFVSIKGVKSALLTFFCNIVVDVKYQHRENMKNVFNKKSHIQSQIFICQDAKRCISLIPTIKKKHCNKFFCQFIEKR